MKFGMFLIGDNSPDLNRNLKDYYDEIIEQVQVAEALGFECFGSESITSTFSGSSLHPR